MEDTLDDLVALRAQVVEVVHVASRGGGLHAADDRTLVDAVARAADLGRLIEALLVEAVGEIAERSGQLERGERLATRMGCHNVNELVQRLTRCSPQTAKQLERAAKATAPAWDPITGVGMPAILPAMREAMLDGEAGIDGVLAVAGPLLGMDDRAAREQVLVADEVLAAEARGEGPDHAPPACADLLRVQAHVWAAALDPDGAEPRDDDSAFRRGLTLGRVRNGVAPVRGNLLPEVAAQLQRISDAINSPYVDGAAGVTFTETPADAEATTILDDRTRPQKLHDALATALFAAAACEELPTIGGAAPTLVVTARAEDIAGGSGWAFWRDATSRCRSRPPDASRAVASSSAWPTTTPAASCGSAPRSGSSTDGSGAHWLPATAGASSPGAVFPPRGARSTTSSTTRRADRRTSTTVCCCAGSITVSSTPVLGASA